PQLTRRGRRPRVGINASRATIILRITAEGANEHQALDAMEPTAGLIYEKLGSLIFGEGDDRLQDAVARLLKKKDKTLATAEWGTGGLVADWLGELEPAGGVYHGGVVVRSSHALSEVLGVSPAVLQRHSAGSAEATGAMAAGCRAKFGADYGLAVGRFPLPGPGAAAHFALATPEGVRAHAHPYANHPELLRVFCAKIALNLVRLELLAR
ncbi:MAG: CinA family protein, partial [Pirellulales bacterium]